jgi:hypothetical protein
MMAVVCGSADMRSSSGVSICTFVPVSKYFCTSKAMEHLRVGRYVLLVKRACSSSSGVSICTFVPVSK